MIASSRPNFARRNRRPGAVMIVAIVLIFIVAGIVVALGASMRADLGVAANHASSVQAAAVERGAEQWVLALLTQTERDLSELPEEDLAAVPVGDGYFWLLRPDYQDDSLPVFGLTEESGKVNINTVSYNSLMMMSFMTDDVAAAIIDWRDTDENVTSGGAEDQYYLSLNPPYHCKNAPFETVEELLMVRGVTPELLYGDGTAPPLGSYSSSGLGSSSGTFMSDQFVSRGIYDLFTIYSVEPNTDPGGAARVNINDNAGRTKLQKVLTDQLGKTRSDQIMMVVNRPFADIFEFAQRAKLTADELDTVVDYLTTTNDKQLKGRVNVNAAPIEVLMTLGLSESDAQTLASARSSSSSTSIAWVMDALKDKAVGLGNRITGKSMQYSADILAVSGDGRAFRRVRIVVDKSGITPKILYRRDLSDRGWPMDPSILESLQSGQGAGALGGSSRLRTPTLGGSGR